MESYAIRGIIVFHMHASSITGSLETPVKQLRVYCFIHGSLQDCACIFKNIVFWHATHTIDRAVPCTYHVHNYFCFAGKVTYTRRRVCTKMETPSNLHAGGIPFLHV